MMFDLIDLQNSVFDALEAGHSVEDVMKEVQDVINKHREVQEQVRKDKMLQEAETNFKEAAAAYMELLAGEPTPEGFMEGFIQIIKEGLAPVKYSVVLPTVKKARDENNEEVNNELVEQIVDIIMKGLGH